MGISTNSEVDVVEDGVSVSGFFDGWDSVSLLLGVSDSSCGLLDEWHVLGDGVLLDLPSGELLRSLNNVRK